MCRLDGGESEETAAGRRVASHVSMVMKELGMEIEVEVSFAEADKMGGVRSMRS